MNTTKGNKRVQLGKNVMMCLWKLWPNKTSCLTWTLQKYLRLLVESINCIYSAWPTAARAGIQFVPITRLINIPPHSPLLTTRALTRPPERHTCIIFLANHWRCLSIYFFFHILSQAFWRGNEPVTIWRSCWRINYFSRTALVWLNAWPMLRSIKDFFQEKPLSHFWHYSYFTWYNPIYQHFIKAGLLISR